MRSEIKTSLYKININFFLYKNKLENIMIKRFEFIVNMKYP